jgi:serine phosphatase RsbU (regulator of sigma subunit)
MHTTGQIEFLFLNIARRFWPELESMNLARRLVGVGDVLTTLYGAILSLAGLGWLLTATDWWLFSDHWLEFLLFAGLIIVFTRLSFFMIIEFRQDRYGSADGAFNSMMVWTGALLFGPTALWPILLLRAAEFLWLWRSLPNAAARWDNVRNLVLTISGFTLPYLLSLEIYAGLGGEYPLSRLDARTLLVGLAAIAANFVLFFLTWLPYLLYAIYTQRRLTQTSETRPILLFFALALSLPTLAHPFALLAAGLFASYGLPAFLFFMAGLIVVAFLARQFSWIAESNRQQSRQLERLEQLGRALLNAPADVTALPGILERHLPNMFPSGNLAIWLIPGQMIYKSTEEWEIDFRPIWDWTSQQTEAQAFLADSPLPWATEPVMHRPIICCPIIAHEGSEVIGGVYLELRRLAQPWDAKSLAKLFPGMQALADQISSAIHQAEEYANSLALQKVGQEIQIAGQIQASFLPNEFPNIPGWQLSVTLEPAGGLSGDFFDFIPLSRGRLGIVIADVADKGLGAALYMALSRTLIRTYALEYHSRPDIVFSETNERVISDARASLFITAFYGVLDPTAGTLTYCNAGHNPPLLIGPQRAEPLSLDRTGMPIGIETDSSWARQTIEFLPGDVLVLYTDGVTDAQNSEGAYFTDERLMQALPRGLESNVFEIQAGILASVREFIGAAPQYDDITLMVLGRDPDKNLGSTP